VGLRDALRRADTAVKETKESVIVSAALAAAAIVVAVVALIVAVAVSR
jgi:hypothetical protein